MPGDIAAQSVPFETCAENLFFLVRIDLELDFLQGMWVMFLLSQHEITELAERPHMSRMCVFYCVFELLDICSLGGCGTFIS